jgi:hypothetical protein
VEDFLRSPPNAREKVRSDIFAGGMSGRDGRRLRLDVKAQIA